MKFASTDKRVQRVALHLNFLFSGICIGTWTSRIPTIKTNFDLNEAELGTLLLSMPIASIIGIPLSSWLVARFESRKPLLFSFLFNIATILIIGFTSNYLLLQVAVFMFAFSLRILNITVNTQSLMVQKLFDKRILGLFHALWSLGSMVGVAITTLMVKYGIAIDTHLLYVSIVSGVVCLIAYPFLIKNDLSPHGNKVSLKKKPDSFLLILGVIVLFASICEGGMFDWSGVYFKEVVKEEIFTLGYLSYMFSMTFSRFISDKLIEALGALKTYLFSGAAVVIGVGTAIIFPSFWPSMIGFGLVGFGS